MYVCVWVCCCCPPFLSFKILNFFIWETKLKQNSFFSPFWLFRKKFFTFVLILFFHFFEWRKISFPYIFFVKKLVVMYLFFALLKNSKIGCKNFLIWMYFYVFLFIYFWILILDEEKLKITEIIQRINKIN